MGCLHHSIQESFTRADTARHPLQERKQREKSTDKARKEKERSKEAKDLAKGFYKGLMQDSDYQGEDYEVFSAWLRETE